LRILLVFSHPRQDSLTHAVAEAFCAGALDEGHEVEWADLYREGFDPLLYEPDEPDRSVIGKRYSEMARVDRNEAIVMIFPVWWWSVPAMLKGWIDRVWNRDWAYGARSLPHKYGLMIGVASSSAASFAKRRYIDAMRIQLETGTMAYCGIANSRLELLYESTRNPSVSADLVRRAHELGKLFPSDN
jgi:NAD(P)H dehydrogenase (quinone)